MNKKLLLQNLLAILCFFAACHVSKNAREKSLPMPVEFDKQGHRGCRGLMPENTIPAMLRAMDLGVTTLEMDVVISRDEQVIVSHDPYFNHEISTLFPGQTNQQAIKASEEHGYNIYRMDLAEIQKIDVGLKPHPRFPSQVKIPVTKPLLSALIDSVFLYAKKINQPVPYFNIETKSLPPGDNIFHPRPAEFVDLLMQVVIQKDIEEKVIIQSFDFRTLQYLHKKYPAIKTAMLIEENDKRSFQTQLAELGFTPDIYSPAHELVKEQLIRDCHHLKMKIIPWTVNDKARMNELKMLGVDGIITDYPDLFN